MPARKHVPGSPCWADLWTSDVGGARHFYNELFGWEPQRPMPEFGGYFMFDRAGVPAAGVVGAARGLRADNAWRVYIETDDIDAAAERAVAGGAQVVHPPTRVGMAGSQCIVVDPTGAVIGLWQPGGFAGFSVVGEPGTPSWFELCTRDYTGAVDFYRSLFGWQTAVIGDPAQFRYTTVVNADGSPQVLGIMDASSLLAQGVAPHWIVYWQVDDNDASAATVKALGGAVGAPNDSHFGRVVTVADPSGAKFRLHTPSR